MIGVIQIANLSFLTVTIKIVTITSETQTLATLLFTTKIRAIQSALLSSIVQGKTKLISTHNKKKLHHSPLHRGNNWNMISILLS